MKYFIQWLIVFSLMTLGLIFGVIDGMLALMNNADFTKISFAILALFLFQSVRIGFSLFRTGGNRNLAESGYFFSDAFVRLGFLGTIAGFIYALHYTFAGINVADVASTQAALVSMARGMGTALYTTAAGLVCGLALRIQLYIYEKTI